MIADQPRVHHPPGHTDFEVDLGSPQQQVTDPDAQHL
jgi:hypothetical protein